MPLVHGPTFRATSNSSMLVLALYYAATLMMGTGMASKVGDSLFERINKTAIARQREKRLLKCPSETRPMILVATICQTFGLFSRNPDNRATVNSFHGGLIVVGLIPVVNGQSMN